MASGDSGGLRFQSMRCHQAQTPRPALRPALRPLLQRVCELLPRLISPWEDRRRVRTISLERVPYILHQKARNINLLIVSFISLSCVFASNPLSVQVRTQSTVGELNPIVSGTRGGLICFPQVLTSESVAISG